MTKIKYGSMSQFVSLTVLSEDYQKCKITLKLCSLL